MPDLINRLFEEEDEEDVVLDFSELLILQKLVLANLDMEKILWSLLKFLDLAFIIHLLLKS